MEIREYGDRSAKTVLVQPVDIRDLSVPEEEISLIRNLSEREFMLAAVPVSNWNLELSPWKAPAVFGKEDFGGGAEETLEEILKYCSDPEKIYYIGGYSLAGLFSLWAACRTDRFRAVAAVSPSVWFPGFDTFLREQEMQCHAVYLSLGDREEKTKNPVMATVGDRIREAYALFRKDKRTCILEWNEGNHFREPDLRCAKGFAWILNTGEQKA